jgi:hypothetical protein
VPKMFLVFYSKSSCKSLKVFIGTLHGFFMTRTIPFKPEIGTQVWRKVVFRPETLLCQ